jgi:hypothetical protein
MFNRGVYFPGGDMNDPNQETQLSSAPGPAQLDLNAQQQRAAQEQPDKSIDARLTALEEDWAKHKKLLHDSGFARPE